MNLDAKHTCSAIVNVDATHAPTPTQIDDMLTAAATDLWNVSDWNEIEWIITSLREAAEELAESPFIQDGSNRFAYVYPLLYHFLRADGAPDLHLPQGHAMGNLLRHGQDCPILRVDNPRHHRTSPPERNEATPAYPLLIPLFYFDIMAYGKVTTIIHLNQLSEY